jgi:hypothetical protein
MGVPESLHYNKFPLLKKLLAILLICILYTPNAARLLLYVQCTLQVAANQQCDCNLSSIPAEQQANFPEKQKEMQQQTDWKYLLAEKNVTTCALPINATVNPLYTEGCYKFAYVASIFRPPCIYTQPFYV